MPLFKENQEWGPACTNKFRQQGIKDFQNAFREVFEQKGRDMQQLPCMKFTSFGEFFRESEEEYEVYTGPELMEWLKQRKWKKN